MALTLSNCPLQAALIQPAVEADCLSELMICMPHISSSEVGPFESLTRPKLAFGNIVLKVKLGLFSLTNSHAARSPSVLLAA